MQASAQSAHTCKPEATFIYSQRVYVKHTHTHTHTHKHTHIVKTHHTHINHHSVLDTPSGIGSLTGSKQSWFQEVSHSFAAFQTILTTLHASQYSDCTSIHCINLTSLHASQYGECTSSPHCIHISHPCEHLSRRHTAHIVKSLRMLHCESDSIDSFRFCSPRAD